MPDREFVVDVFEHSNYQAVSLTAIVRHLEPGKGCQHRVEAANDADAKARAMTEHRIDCMRPHEKGATR